MTVQRTTNTFYLLEELLEDSRVTSIGGTALCGSSFVFVWTGLLHTDSTMPYCSRIRLQLLQALDEPWMSEVLLGLGEASLGTRTVDRPRLGRQAREEST